MGFSRIHAILSIEDMFILMGMFIVGKIIEAWVVEKIKARSKRLR